MAEGLGLLEAAQSAASNIPYKNLALDNPAEIALNAFARASAVNHQKLALEQQIAALNYRIQRDQEDAAFDREKFAWQQKFQAGEQQRKIDALGTQAHYAELRADLAQKTFDLTTGLKATRAEQAAIAARELQKAVEGKQIGSNEAAAAIGKVQSDYAAALDTPEGKAVWSQFQDSQRAAAMAKHRALNDNRRLLKDVLGTQGEGGFGFQELQRPKDTFLTSVDDKGNTTLNVIEYPVNLGGGKLDWRPISNDEVMKYSTRDKRGQVRFGPELEKKYPGVRWRQTTEANYDKVLKPMYDSSYGQIDPTDIGGQPQPVTGAKQLDSDTAHQFLMQANGDKEAARQLARAAGYVF